jgi:hypothetical protein
METLFYYVREGINKSLGIYEAEIIFVFMRKPVQRMQVRTS